MNLLLQKCDDKKMKEKKVNHSIIKIIGLLGEYPKSLRKLFQNDLLKNGYKEDGGSVGLNKILKDMGINTNPIWNKIEDLIVKTLISVESKIYSALEIFSVNNESCFELFGFGMASHCL
jgi:hypothetical protein